MNSLLNADYRKRNGGLTLIGYKTWFGWIAAAFAFSAGTVLVHWLLGIALLFVVKWLECELFSAGWD